MKYTIFTVALGKHHPKNRIPEAINGLVHRKDTFDTKYFFLFDSLFYSNISDNSVKDLAADFVLLVKTNTEGFW